MLNSWQTISTHAALPEMSCSSRARARPTRIAWAKCSRSNRMSGPLQMHQSPWLLSRIVKTTRITESPRGRGGQQGAEAFGKGTKAAPNPVQYGIRGNRRLSALDYNARAWLPLMGGKDDHAAWAEAGSAMCWLRLCASGCGTSPYCARITGVEYSP